jgi:hypothetical protein
MGPQEKRILGLIADDSTAVPLLNLPFTYTPQLKFRYEGRPLFNWRKARHLASGRLERYGRRAFDAWRR